MEKLSAAQAKFLLKEKRHKQKVFFLRILILILCIAVLDAAERRGLMNDFIFSSPSLIGSLFLTMAKDGSIFYHIGVTLMETVASFLLVTVLGLLLAILLWSNKGISETLEPYLVVLTSLPKSALAPVLIVWLGNNLKTIIVVGIIIAVFGSIITLTTGFLGVDQDKIKLIYTLGGKKKDVLSKVLVPSSIPIIISTMKVNIGLCLVGIIIGEFLAANKGLGYLIIYGSQVFKMDLVMLSIIVLCVLSAILYYFITMLEKKVKKKF